MPKFQKTIQRIQTEVNTKLIIKNLFAFISLLLLSFNIFLVVFGFTVGHKTQLFLFALSIKIFVALMLLFYVLQTNKNLLSKFQSAKLADRLNDDKDDTLQNALELSEAKENEFLDLIFEKADEAPQPKTSGMNIIKPVLLPFIITVCLTIFGYAIHKPVFAEAFDFMKLNKAPKASHKTFVEVSPGNKSVSANSDVTIEVVYPEAETEHTLFYKTEDIWRETGLYENSKVFNNLDFSFDYFIQNPYAVSDTFRIEVFENPIVKKIKLTYEYPSYSKQKTFTDSLNSGNIKALKNTKVYLEFTANNPIKEAEMIFGSGSRIEPERLGKSSFRTEFKVNRNDNYYIRLTDILNNTSEDIKRSIQMIPDKFPEVEIVYPGKDTILTQNMLMNLKIIASDDYGLSDMRLFYYINSEAEQALSIRSRIKSSLINLDYILDLSSTYLFPGDKVTYWVEVADNSPDKQKTVSKKYVIRFPSIEEIYKEIEEEEEAKSNILEDVLKESKELQEEFEEKRRDLMKKDEADWDDKKELEEFVDQQSELMEKIENVAENYQDLIEKMEENHALSQETLEKMEKIQELMDEIANDEMQKALEDLQKKMEEMTPEQMKEALKDFKFSMEDFSENLEQTIKMLEDIKKEQALQKALEIAEEMEEMQDALNERTSQEDTDNKKAAEDQKQISDKMESLKEQLEKTEELFDEQDSEIQEAMDELQEMMEQDSLQQDMQESMEKMQQNKMQQAKPSQSSSKQKMSKMRQKLSEMMSMMSSGAMGDMSEAINAAINRLLIFSAQHEISSEKYDKNPFVILPDQISNYESINLSLKKLYETPMIFMMLGPKFMYDTNAAIAAYKEMFSYINEAKNAKVKTYLAEIQAGINLMIYDLMQAESNMQQSQGSGG